MRNTRKNKVKKYTVENKFPKNYTPENVILTFIEMLNTIKLYHWKTKSYPTHKATDELYADLNTNLDTFVETMLGKTGGRFDLMRVKCSQLNDYNSIDGFRKNIDCFTMYLINMTNNINFKQLLNSDLLNIRDEILGNINKFLYLLTFE